MGDDNFDELSAMWGVPLNEPPAVALPVPPRPADRADDSFLLRGDDPPTDGVYRPRLRGFGDAA